jgi:hypothetical protein
MLTLNQPPLTQHISIPKDMSQLSVEAYTAGLVEGVMDGLGLVRTYFWRVTDDSLQELLLIQSERTSIHNEQSS